MNARDCCQEECANAGKPLSLTEMQRLSSHLPRYTLLALLCGAGCVILLTILRGDLPAIAKLLLLGIAAAQMGAAVIAFKTWKCVWKKGDTLIVSDGFKTELLSGDDIVMSVARTSLFGKRVRVHLNRPTRFGWHFQFIPLDQQTATHTLRLTSSRQTE